MKRQIRWVRLPIECGGYEKRYRIYLKKPIPIETSFDGIDWKATALDGLISGSTKIHPQKTEAMAIWSLRSSLGRRTTVDILMYARKEWTPKGMEKHEKIQKAIRPFLSNTWIDQWMAIGQGDDDGEWKCPLLDMRDSRKI